VIKRLVGSIVVAVLATLGLHGTAGAAVPRCGTMLAGESLAPGEELSSCNGRYRLVHQADGNVVVYDGATALWFSDTAGRATTTLVFQPEGNIVLYAGDAVAWAVQTHTSNKGVSFVLQDDGNLVVYGENGKVKWHRAKGYEGEWVPQPQAPVFTGCIKRALTTTREYTVTFSRPCYLRGGPGSLFPDLGAEYTIVPNTYVFVPN
jgi:hypothetical protein